MARNGHPRVPRAVRGERKRQARLLKQVTARHQRRWKMTPVPKFNVTEQGVVLHSLRDIYGPMVTAQLLGPTHLPKPMSQRG